MPLTDSLAAFGRYLRVSPTGLEIESPPSSRFGAVLFVDVDVDASTSHFGEALAAIRKMDPAGLMGVSEVLVRWPSRQFSGAVSDGARELLARLIRQLPMSCAAGFVVGSPAKAPEILWLADCAAPQSSELDLLRRCRAVELGSLLANGGAIWEPEDYHYRLPSGRHSSSFVRFADCVRSVRDADVIAWWLQEELSGGQSLILDSPSLVPVALSLQKIDPTINCEILPPYPSTAVAYERSLRRRATGASGVIALLSVSSSGTVHDRMSTALRSLEIDSSLHVLVDKATENLPEDGSSWLALASSSESQADSCQLCATAARSRVVHIDPASFGSILLPQPDLLVPDIMFGSKSKRFWELCDEAGALTLDTSPHANALAARPQNFRMSVRVDFETLLHQEHISTRLLSEARELWSGKQFDVAVVDQGEARVARGAGGTLLKELSEIVGARSLVEVGQDGEFSDETDVVDADSVVLLALGVVSGTKLQRALAAVTELKRREQKTTPTVHAHVVHLRPLSERSRETISNSFFPENFQALFECVLPVDLFPLRDEFDMIRDFPDSELSPKAREFAEQRRVFSAGPDEGFAVFWGMGEDPDVPANRLRPGSLYGESLSALAALVATGAAVHKARSSRRAVRAPTWLQFEMPAILDLYFDPLLVCSIFRWIRPAECWWGRDAVDAPPVIQRFLSTYKEPHEQRIIAAELLLASAQGKVPRSAVPKLEEFGADIIARGEDHSGAVELALSLSKHII